jgi:hypothetical protein
MGNILKNKVQCTAFKCGVKDGIQGSLFLLTRERERKRERERERERVVDEGC